MRLGLLQVKRERHKERKAGNKEQLLPTRIRCRFVGFTNDLLDGGRSESGRGKRE